MYEVGRVLPRDIDDVSHASSEVIIHDRARGDDPLRIDDGDVRSARQSPSIRISVLGFLRIADVHST